MRAIRHASAARDQAMGEPANYAGLIELIVVGAVALAIGAHQLADLRREKRKREAAKEKSEI
jgi:hypothetical protein